MDAIGDEFFSSEQCRRLQQLMGKWRTARDQGAPLLAPEFAELRQLIELELKASGKRAAKWSQSMRTKTSSNWIEKTPDVSGGDACIRQTRIPVWLLVSLKSQGMSDGKLLEGYPGLSQDDLEAAWAYYKDHSEEIDAAIREQEHEE